MEYFDLLFYKFLKGVQSKGRINTNFSAYVNGTEQLLPVNTSAPATTPFLGDIRYSDGYRNDQYFTYRESPTTVDGLAKIKGIRGNTLVWNQLVNTNTSSVILTSGHKFITKVSGTFSLVEGTGQSLSVTGGTDEVFDLTIMFGSGNEPTTVDGFTSLFPLPYYAYNSGSLLSFKGTAIKTTGKNQYNNATGLRNLYLNQNTGLLSNGGTTYIADLLPNKQYTLSGTRGNRSLIGFSRKRANELGNGDAIENISSKPLPYTFNSSDYCSVVYYSNTDYVATLGTDIQLELGSSVTDYEPYTENTTTLPTETYFPTGMKSAGSVYDELLPTKAITRVGAVDLGSLSWSAVNGVMKATISDSKGNGECICVPYTSTTATVVNAKTEDKVVALDNINRVCVYDSAYTSASAFKTAMSGVYLYYELATPTEADVGEEAVLSTYNKALSTILGKTVSVNNPQEAIEIITKGE